MRRRLRARAHFQNGKKNKKNKKETYAGDSTGYLTVCIGYVETRDEQPLGLWQQPLPRPLKSDRLVLARKRTRLKIGFAISRRHIRDEALGDAAIALDDGDSHRKQTDMGAATETPVPAVQTTATASESSSSPVPQPTMHKSARGEAYYRDVLLQMQSEFARAVAALEKQISCLTEHNELLVESQQQQQSEIAVLKQEQHDVDEARRREQQLAADAVRLLQEELAMSREDLRSEQLKMQSREESLQHECAALKTLLQQEQDYWTRFEKTKQSESEKLNLQVAEARAECLQRRDCNDSLCREIKLLQSRVDTAVRTSRNFEQRLKILSHQKHDEQMALEAELLRLKRKVSEKREQNKYLSEALVVAREDASRRQRPSSAASQAAVRSPSSISSTSSTFSDPVTESTLSSQYQPTHLRTRNAGSQQAEFAQPTREKRLRKRDITLSMPSAKRANIPSPTASSPDTSPPPTPHQRDVATSNTTHISSRTSRQPTSQKTGALGARSVRLDREMSDLRQKLDACMQFSLSP